MPDETVYKKVGDNTYEPIGILEEHRVLYNGLWYVHGGSTTSVPYMGQILHLGNSEIVDLPKLAGLYDYIEWIRNYPPYKELFDKGSYTIQDLTCTIVSAIFKYNQQLVNPSLFYQVERNKVFNYQHHPLFKENLVNVKDRYFLPKWLVDEVDEENSRQTENN